MALVALVALDLEGQEALEALPEVLRTAASNTEQQEAEEHRIIL